MSFFKKIIPETPKQAFLIAFLLCALAGLFIILVLAPLTGISKDFSKAHDGYIELAKSLGQGDGYVFEKNGAAVFHRPPLYPFLLVPITFLPEHLQRTVLILMQSALVGFIAALIFKIAQYFFTLSVAKISVIIFLLNPWVYWNAKNPMTTILQGLLYLIFAVLIGKEILTIMGHYENKTKLAKRRLAIGLTAAALALTHGTMLAVNALLFFILLIIAIAKRNRQAIKTPIIAGLIMAALIAPWTYRNYIVFDRIIPVAGGGGLAYFNGNVHWQSTIENPQRKGESYIDASLRVCDINGTEATHAHWMGLKDIELDDRVNKKMVENIRTHPDIFAKKIALNAVEYYFPTLASPFLAVKGFSLQKLAITIFHLTLWILAIIGLCRNQKNPLSKTGKKLILSAIVIYAIWFFPFATFIGHSLYTFGTIPFLSILAADGLTFRNVSLALQND